MDQKLAHAVDDVVRLFARHSGGVARGADVDLAGNEPCAAGVPLEESPERVGREGDAVGLPSAFGDAGQAPGALVQGGE